MWITAGRGCVSLLIVIHKSDERRFGFCSSSLSSEKQEDTELEVQTNVWRISHSGKQACNYM